MLSDHEQRALEEIERSLATGPSEGLRPGQPWAAASRRRLRTPGRLPLVALGCVSAALLLTGAPVAALAIATATAIGWTYWRLWARSAGDGGFAAALLCDAGRGQGLGGRPRETMRAFLRWLAESE